MKMNRLSLAAIATVVVASVSVPTAGFAFQQGPGAFKSTPKQPNVAKHKPINTNVCTPGRPGFNPDQCHADITSKK
jgi:hypothetical protein